MMIREEMVTNFLNANSKFLENYISGPYVSNEMFRAWTMKRNGVHANPSRHIRLSGSWDKSDLKDRRLFILENYDKTVVMLYEIASACAQLITINDFDVLIQNDEGIFAVIRNGNSVTLKRSRKRIENAVFRQKLIDCIGITIGEIVFYRQISARDQKVINVLCTWGCAMIHFSQRSTGILPLTQDNSSDFTSGQLNEFNTFLLDVAKSMFQDIVSMDAVITKVMNFAQKLTNADRASLFLVDHRTKELYARIFDIRTDTGDNVLLDEFGRKEIRFPFDKGIGGYVVLTGKSLNIENAYEDDRFNPEIDFKTGYKTRNILCMPIFIRGTIIGVVQMVNKAEGPFTKLDEKAFETFAVYCALALHHAKLYDKINRSEKKYRVALEVLSYHNRSTKNEVEALNSLEMREHIEELETFEFDGLRLDGMKQAFYAVYMFKNLLKEDVRWDDDDLVRFVLTVRKNYRNVAYHNWAHGWSVAHAMFVTLKISNAFTAFEALALFTASLCHDLDHRGKSNSYMKLMDTPLAAMYSTSVMEHHHFNQAVTILQQDGHNIFKSLSSRKYKTVLKLIKHCILSTDLAVFFANKVKIREILDNSEFSWSNNSHRTLIQAITMTGCDLIAAAKPWEIHAETVKVIFQEFYEQGDAERMNGKQPIASMDRNRAHELPVMQVEFIRDICIPCYEILAEILPETEQILKRCRCNADKWQKIANENNIERKQ